jgi:hypothetical protein
MFYRTFECYHSNLTRTRPRPEQYLCHLTQAQPSGRVVPRSGPLQGSSPHFPRLFPPNFQPGCGPPFSHSSLAHHRPSFSLPLVQQIFPLIQLATLCLISNQFLPRLTAIHRPDGSNKLRQSVNIYQTTR